MCIRYFQFDWKCSNISENIRSIKNILGKYDIKEHMQCPHLFAFAMTFKRLVNVTLKYISDLYYF